MDICRLKYFKGVDDCYLDLVPQHMARARGEVVAAHPVLFVPTGNRPTFHKYAGILRFVEEVWVDEERVIEVVAMETNGADTERVEEETAQVDAVLFLIVAEHSVPHLHENENTVSDTVP